MQRFLGWFLSDVQSAIVGRHPGEVVAFIFTDSRFALSSTFYLFLPLACPLTVPLELLFISHTRHRGLWNNPTTLSAMAGVIALAMTRVTRVCIFFMISFPPRLSLPCVQKACIIQGSKAARRLALPGCACLDKSTGDASFS